MADQKISELTAITGANSAGDDVYVVVDTSTGETKKITRAELFKNTPALDVTGTATMDGLTVGSTASGVLTDQDNIVFKEGGYYIGAVSTTDSDNINGITLESAFNGNILLKSYYGFTSSVQGAGIPRLHIQGSTGDISFYEQTGTTPKFFWDSSAESLGIGTSSPSARLHLQNGAENADLALFRSGINTSRGLDISLTNNNTVNDAYVVYDATLASFGGHIWQQAGTERMRLDSSGNLLVGTTTTFPGLANTVAGVSISEDAVWASRSGNVVGSFNRNTSDGDILQFRTDGTPVGSIGTKSSQLFIGQSNTGLGFADSVDTVFPYDVTGQAGRDNAINLGSSSARFKDLYLSGGVYVGGTGAANYLDDYETGTHTATLTTSGGQSYTLSGSTLAYEKVGSLVHVQGHITVSAIPSTPTGRLLISLPFSVGVTTSPQFQSAISIIGQGTTLNVNQWVGFSSDGADKLNVYRGDGTTVSSGADNAGPVGVGDSFWISATYRTTA